MAVLMYLDHPSQFTVYVDGAVEARIQKAGDAWLLHSLRNPAKVVDVSAVINHHDELEPVIIENLKGESEKLSE